MSLKTRMWLLLLSVHFAFTLISLPDVKAANIGGASEASVETRQVRRVAGPGGFINLLSRPFAPCMVDLGASYPRENFEIGNNGGVFKAQVVYSNYDISCGPGWFDNRFSGQLTPAGAKITAGYDSGDGYLRCVQDKPCTVKFVIRVRPNEGSPEKLIELAVGTYGNAGVGNNQVYITQKGPEFNFSLINWIHNKVREYAACGVMDYACIEKKKESRSRCCGGGFNPTSGNRG